MSGPAPLVGALGTLALADVLQLLELGRKTGVLAVDAGDGRRRGLVRLAAGRVTDARMRDGDGRDLRDPYDTVAALLGLHTGRFTFVPGPAPAADAGGIRIEVLLMEAVRRADERTRAEAVADVAPAWPIPTLAGDAAAATVDAAPLALGAADWALLAAVDGAGDVAAVAARVGRGPAEVAAALDELARAGVVRLLPAPVSAAAVPAGPPRSSSV